MTCSLIEHVIEYLNTITHNIEFLNIYIYPIFNQLKYNLTQLNLLISHLKMVYN